MSLLNGAQIQTLVSMSGISASWTENAAPIMTVMCRRDGSLSSVSAQYLMRFYSRLCFIPSVAMWGMLDTAPCWLGTQRTPMTFGLGFVTSR